MSAPHQLDRFTRSQLETMHLDAYLTCSRLIARIQVITDTIRQCPLTDEGDAMVTALEADSRLTLAAISEQEELAHAISEHMRDRDTSAGTVCLACQFGQCGRCNGECSCTHPGGES